MGKSGKKPRQKMSAGQHGEVKKVKKEDRDWSFDDIARSKGKGR